MLSVCNSIYALVTHAEITHWRHIFSWGVALALGPLLQAWKEELIDRTIGRESSTFLPNRSQHHLNEIMHEASNDSSVVMMINPGWHDKHCSSGKQWIVPKWRIGLLRRGGISACRAEKVLKTILCVCVCACFSLQEEYLYEIKWSHHQRFSDLQKKINYFLH